MANGGQILLTGEGLEQLRGNFKDAGFPRIEHLGQYSLSAMNEVVDLYEVGPGIVSTLPRRTFLKGYKGATMIGDKTNGLLIHTDLDAIKGRAAIISMKTRGSISAGVLKKTETTLATCAQIFCGHFVFKDIDSVSYSFVFQDTLDAVRFALAAQLALNYVEWDLTGLSLQTEYAASGRVIFNGPRIAMVIHESADFLFKDAKVEASRRSYFGRRLSVTSVAKFTNTPTFMRVPTRGRSGSGSAFFEGLPRSHSKRDSFASQASTDSNGQYSVGEAASMTTSFFDSISPNMSIASMSANTTARFQNSLVSGPLWDDTYDLLRRTHGGQIVLTEEAWASVQHRTPDRVQVICLGSHRLKLGDPVKALMELTPMLIGARHFPPIASDEVIFPGYRESPSPNREMAILFCQALLPEEYDEVVVKAIQLWSELCRKQVAKYNGYICKEPDPGKFTLAFEDFEDAIVFAATTQEALLHLEWMDELLAREDFAEQYDGTGKKLLWRGLNVRMGIVYGKPTFRKPLAATGTADYFGPLANLAARVMSKAYGGQVLLEPADHPNIDYYSYPFWVLRDGLQIILKAEGKYKFKGVDSPVMMLSCALGSLTAREFPKSKAFVEHADNVFEYFIEKELGAEVIRDLKDPTMYNRYGAGRYARGRALQSFAFLPRSIAPPRQNREFADEGIPEEGMPQLDDLAAVVVEGLEGWASGESPAASRDTDAPDGDPDTPVSGPGSPLTVTPKGAFTPDDLDSPHFSASAPRRTSLAPKEPAKNNWVPGQPGGM